jgi:DNA-binding beta-propeller fold protein YncE
VTSVRRWRNRPARFGWVVVASAVVSLAIVAGAFGALGDLTPAGCIEDLDSDGLAGCGATAQGLEAAVDIAVSPDGGSAYAVSEANDDTIVRFDRSPSGVLTPAGCIADVGDPAGCGATAHGLNGAEDVTVSPDGASVYVASSDDEAIVRFDRAASGALSNSSCIEDIEINGSCGGEAQGLNSAAGVAVSSDGTSVYVVSFTDDTIVRFDRAANGVLTPAGCIEDVEINGLCGGEAQGLNSAAGVAVSSDGASVYAVSQDDDAIVRFDRAADGTLSNSSCIEDVETNLECDNVGATGEVQGLDRAVDVAVSPDGASVYVAGANDDAIVRFDRGASGALSNSSCLSDTATGACGPTETADGLNQPAGVTVSSDGASVYAVSQNSDAIVRFDRAPSGVLSNSSCIEDPEHNESCDDVGAAGETQGLAGATGVAVSTDGASVYAAGTSDDAIVRFDREIPPAPPSDGEAADTDPPDTQITKGPKNKTKKKRATFEFTATEPGSSFQCAVDGQALKVPCTSPYTVKVKKGKHTFQVRATDQAGNVDASPASDGWKVKKKTR